MMGPAYLSHAITTGLAAFLASLVECVEALTIVLAVGATRGWASALTGAGFGILVLAASVLIAGPFLPALPMAAIKGPVGLLLLLFGLRWLRKAILRAAGVMKLRDEDAAYKRASASIAAARPHPLMVPLLGWLSLDRPAMGTAFQIVMLEGIEVVFIVLAAGTSGGQILPASVGAGLALAVVCGLGVLLHRPLSRVPENTLKFVVGVLLTAFGTFWTGEALGVAWPGGDASLPLLSVIWAVIAVACTRQARAIAHPAPMKAGH